MIARTLSLTLVICFIFTLQPYGQHTKTVTLAGYHHVPPVPSPGSGNIDVTLRGDTLSVKGEFNQLSSAYYGAFIHYGDEDEQGNQLFRMEPELDKSKIGGTFDPERNKWKLNETLLQALAEGRLYINIYSNNYTRGELRGQVPPMK